MNCEDLEMSIYLFHELDEVDRAVVMEHTKSCPSCAALLNQVSTQREQVLATGKLGETMDSQRAKRIMEQVTRHTLVNRTQPLPLAPSLLIRFRQAMVAVSITLISLFLYEWSTPGFRVTTASSEKMVPIKSATLSTRSILKDIQTAREETKPRMSTVKQLCLQYCMAVKPSDNCDSCTKR